MNRRELWLRFLWFVGGGLFSVVVIVVAFLVDTRGGGRVRFAGPRFLGDAKMWVEGLPAEATEAYNASQEFCMAKTDSTFLAVEVDAADKVAGVSILNPEGRIFFTMSDSDNREWHKGIYGGCSDSGYPSGEMYIDLDVDGHFDVKYVLGEKGKKESKWIYLAGLWEQVEHVDVDGLEAQDANAGYIFEWTSGWKKGQPLEEN